jgi:hypothetical protein
MAITYTWKLTSLKKYDNYEGTDHVVFQTYWKKTGTDENGNTGEFSGATPLDITAINTGTFISYSELTEEDVLSWIKPVVVGEYERHVNEKIADQIRAKSMVEVQIESNNLPWIPEDQRNVTPDPTSVVASPSGPPAQ